MDSGVTKQDLFDMEARLAAHVASQVQASEDRTAAQIANQLQASEDRTAALIANQLRASEDRTATLIASEVGSLHNDMGLRFARVDLRLESIDTRLKLQAGLIQSGARAMARFSAFAENSEERWVELVGRVEALEPKSGGGEGSQK
jgi:hypothetical protein